MIATGTQWPGTVLFLSLAMFLLGGILYVLLFVLILYRWLFFDIWADFLAMIENCKAQKTSNVIVACPSVLGDTYEEIIESLSLLAEAGLVLHITGRES